MPVPQGLRIVLPKKKLWAVPALQGKDRHVVECTFGALKYFRRISSRFEKKSNKFHGNAELCSSYAGLRQLMC